MKTIDRLANEFYDPKIHDAHSKPSLAYYAYRAGFLKARELAVDVSYLAIGGGSNEAVKAQEINKALRRLGDEDEELPIDRFFRLFEEAMATARPPVSDVKEKE